MSEFKEIIDKVQHYKTLNKKFAKDRKYQHMRGLNNFNPFTILRKHDAEVLHSKTITYFLDPNGGHNQGSLFLELFLKEVDLNGYFLNPTKCNVYREYNFIDIYITDGNKHIIIENKVYAVDQPQQIKRYIEAIKSNENTIIDNDNLVIVYISLRILPSEISLSDGGVGYVIKGKRLVNKQNEHESFQFIHLLYNDKIKHWLERSYAQVENITNLSVGISQYIDVVQQLSRKYRTKSMNFYTYLNENHKDEIKEIVDGMKTISNSFSELHTEVYNNFITIIQDGIKEKLAEYHKNDNTEAWEYWFEENNNGCKQPVKIYQKGTLHEACINFTIQLGGESSNLCFGIKYSNSLYYDEVNSPYAMEVLNKYRDELKSIGMTDTNGWFPYYKYYYSKDLFNIILEDCDNAANKVVKAAMENFEKCKKVIIECNKVCVQS